MSIRNWPKSERPCEKLFFEGPEYLSNAELLAVLLHSGTKGKNAVELARELLEEFGGLQKVLTVCPKRLATIKGIGKGKAVILPAAFELGKRYLKESLQETSLIDSSEKAKRFLRMHLGPRKSEVFSCLFLNSRNRLVHYEEMFQGTINCAPIYPRIVLQKALEYNAAAVIFAHNHPSGSAMPSDFDKTTTKQLVAALAQISIQVKDHVIVSEHEVFSFAEEGLLDD